MTTLRRLTYALALTLCALSLTARAQTPEIEVTTDAGSAQFSAQGRMQLLRVQVFSPAGELVFEAEAQGGRSLRWPMTDQKGVRAADGVYRAHVTFTDSSGKLRARVEQITVGSQAQGAVAAPAASAPQDSLAPTGAGTAGRLAKWTTSTNLGNSVVAESSGRLAVNPTAAVPTATLQVNGLQPAASSSNGVAAPTLLTTTGGKGGNTTAAGKVGGKGANITLTAGQGGNAVSGATSGTGGDIILQPGSPGTGGSTPGKAGKVLLAPTGNGIVSIGTNNPDPNSKLYVELSSTTGSAITGKNLVGVGVYGISNTDPGVSGYSQNDNGVEGSSPNGIGVYGNSTSGYAGIFDGKVAVFGNVGIGTPTPSRPLEIKSGQLRFSSNTGDVEFTEVADLLAHVTTASPAATLPALRVHAGTSLTTVFTVFSNGKTEVGGTLQVDGGSCTGCSPPSDRALKANISSVNPRLILNKLAALPIQTWNYKSEPETVRHLGPMAQDFRAAFGLGRDDHTLNTVDAQGVTMASVQALYQLMLEKDQQIQRLVLEKDKEIERQMRLSEQQGRRIARLEARLNQVSHTVRRKRATPGRSTRAR